jgi:hypothetical protein
MLPKVAAIEKALAGGVPRVHVISYSLPDSLLLEVFTNEGTGTLVVDDIKHLSPAEQVTLRPAMARLWDKGLPLDERILRFTAGEDHRLDERLVAYDVRASIAHARMLERRACSAPRRGSPSARTRSARSRARRRRVVDEYLAKLVLEPKTLDALLERSLNLVLVVRIGVNHVPLQRHASAPPTGHEAREPQQ